MRQLALVGGLLLLSAGTARASEPVGVYPWQDPPPEAILPCVPCVLGLPDLSWLAGSGQPAPLPAPDGAGSR